MTAVAPCPPGRGREIERLTRPGRRPAGARAVAVRQGRDRGVQARPLPARESREGVDALERVVRDVVVLPRVTPVLDVDGAGRADRLVARRVAAAGRGVVRGAAVLVGPAVL